MHPVEALLTPLGKLFRNRHADESLSLSHRLELASKTRIEFTSPRFEDGQEIPAIYCGRFIGDNISPALVWGNLPPATEDMLLIMEDLDSPGATPRLHAVAAFGPEPNALDDGDLHAGAKRSRFLQDWSRPLSYSGPRPLPGHGPHRYRLHLYALDRQIEIEHLTNHHELATAVDGHILASGTLSGTRTS